MDYDDTRKRQRREVIENATAVESSRGRLVAESPVKKTKLSSEYEYVHIYQHSMVFASRSRELDRIIPYDRIHALRLGFQDGILVSLKLWPEGLTGDAIFVQPMRAHGRGIPRDAFRDTIWACDSPMNLKKFFHSDEEVQKLVLRELGVVETRQMRILDRIMHFKKFDVYEFLAPELKSRYASNLSRQLLAQM